jgi:hypothetical protein
MGYNPFLPAPGNRDENPLGYPLAYLQFIRNTAHYRSLAATLADWGLNWSGRLLEPIAQRVVVTPFESAFLPLSFPRLDQVLQATRSLDRGRAAFGTSPVTLHSQLVFPLPGNRHLSELILNSSSHLLCARNLSSRRAAKVTRGLLDNNKIFTVIARLSSGSAKKRENWGGTRVSNEALDDTHCLAKPCEMRASFGRAGERSSSA